MVMVRKNTLWLAMGLMMLSLASCNKDESGEPFTLSTKQYNGGAKTYINSGTNKEYACWKDGDKVLINGTEKTVSVSSGSGNTYEATVDGSDIAESESYISVYPASSSSISGSAITTTIPQTTTYTTISSGAGAGCQVIDAPMAAYSTTRGLTYENICALTKFQVKAASGTTAKLLSLRIETDQNINGTLTAYANSGSWTTSLTGSGTSRELSFGDGLELTSTAKAVYLYLPEVSDITSFTVYATVSFGGSVHYFYKTKSGSISLNKGYLYDFGTLTATQSGTTYTLADDQSTSYGEKAPDGSAAFPYCISNATEWSNIMAAHATDAGAYFQLTGDFGITSSVPTFNGILDGDNHAINVSNCAVFKVVQNATIKELAISGAINFQSASDISGYDPNLSFIGSLACSTYNCTIENIINNCNIKIQATTSNEYFIGGIIGKAQKTTVNKCFNKGAITIKDITSSHVGGVVGTTSAATTIKNCANTGAIDAICQVGGIVCTNSSTQALSNCFNYANLKGSNGVGGICYSSQKPISNCYFYGEISASNLSLAAAICYTPSSEIKYCYYQEDCCPLITHSPTISTTHCYPLSSPTTITGGTDLATTLNSNISTLNLTDALRWEEQDGIVTFVEQ